ncbi:hypothetical protein BD410DRAFT_480703 [Rickenella mellea]|uniref:BTB domain-containing protein n=1 Tax=Rickenella mellea TaxID=50990 RepID=A0A4Y7QIC5_9AGAM|nr:hypothetical protein BD410DRAFT_480703 [Rickenella mellea]
MVMADAERTKYKIILRDEEFTLYKTQIEFDAPNYFTACFFGEFAESKQTTIALDRNPDLFALIVEYMSGYCVLPISAKALPRTMDIATATANLVEDAAFYGLSRLHALLTRPAPPRIDFAWTGFSGTVVSFDDVLKGKLPDGVSYTTSGLCSFGGNNSGKPVIIYAKDIPLRLEGNLELDKSGRPPLNSATATYQLDLTNQQKAQLEMQPYSAFEFHDVHPKSLVVSVYPESRLHLDGTSSMRVEQFALWWRTRRVFGFAGMVEPADEQALRIFDEAFPRPFEDAPRREEFDRNEFVLWGDELLFVITARGFIAGTLQLHVKLLSVWARTRATVLETLRPPAPSIQGVYV